MHLIFVSEHQNKDRTQSQLSTVALVRFCTFAHNLQRIQVRAISRLIDRMPNKSCDVLTGQATVENGNDVDNVECTITKRKKSATNFSSLYKARAGTALNY